VLDRPAQRGELLEPTDARGELDSAEIAVALGELQASPFGAGARVDHVELIDPIGFGVYVSGPLPYAVP